MARGRRLIAVMLTIAVMALGTVPALAITYGRPDNDGHPNVGALVIEVDGQKRWICSGTLIAEKVFLTAAHCTAAAERRTGSDRAWVTFDSDIRDIDHATLYAGTMHTNPGYNPSQSDPGDIAVVVLDAAPAGLTPARLAPLGFLDEKNVKNGLRDQTFTNVGYGRHEPEIGGGPPRFTGGGERWVSTSSFNALNKNRLHLSQNNATSDSGTCYGDSGGPQFFGDSDLIVSITMTGDAMCLATNLTYRVDTESARAFLKGFVALP